MYFQRVPKYHLSEAQKRIVKPFLEKAKLMLRIRYELLKGQQLIRVLEKNTAFESNQIGMNQIGARAYMRDIRLTPEELELIRAYRKSNMSTKICVNRVLNIKEPERQQDAGRILVFEQERAMQ